MRSFVRQDDVTQEPVLRDLFTKLRWPRGVACPRLGCEGVASEGAGVYRCRRCRRRFTFRTGTFFEKSQIPLHKWYRIVEILCEPGGATARELSTRVGLTHPNACSLLWRVRRLFGLPAGRAELSMTVPEVLARMLASPPSRGTPPPAADQTRSLRIVPREAVLSPFSGTTPVYFIQAGEDGPVKVGVAKRPRRVLANLQVAHHEELRLLRVVKLDEAAFRERFAGHHIQNGWYRWDRDVAAFVEAATGTVRTKVA